jgi:hypothetical protein
MAMTVYLKNDSVKLGTAISRDEFIRMDPGEIYDHLTCCGAPAIIFRHDNGGHVVVEDCNSVFLDD